LIANRESWQDAWKRRKLEDMRMLLEGAINALGKVGLMLNVHQNDLRAVLEVLPALKRPTISHLSDEEWLAVNTILDEIHRARHHPAPEAGGRAGHRGISAQQDRLYDPDSGCQTQWAACWRGARPGWPKPKPWCAHPGSRAQARRQALLEYARQFDALDRKTVACPQPICSAPAPPFAEFRDAVEPPPPTFARSPNAASRRNAARSEPGLQLGQVVRPLDTVAAYIPAGRYPLPSTLMMTVIPAQVAGVPNICVACPRPCRRSWAPRTAGRAAGLSNGRRASHRGLRLRHAHRAARRPHRRPRQHLRGRGQEAARGRSGHRLRGRPHRDPDHLRRWRSAASRRRHAGAGRARCGCGRHPAHHFEAARQCGGEGIERQLADLPTAAVARKAIERNSAIMLVRSLEEAVELSNRFAPEHLSIPDDRLLARVRHAGSVFIGPFSTEAAGDYASGPNHVLPTSGAARMRGGLSVADYLKVISVQQLSREALAALAPAITTLARAEGWKRTRARSRCAMNG
jgi:histidinol dehydrogenase